MFILSFESHIESGHFIQNDIYCGRLQNHTLPFVEEYAPSPSHIHAPGLYVFANIHLKIIVAATVI